MKIEINHNLTSSVYFGTQAKHSNSYGEHFYHNCAVGQLITIDGVEHLVEWQNGHSFVGNDLNLPRNSFTVYSDNCEGPLSDAFWDVYNASEDDIDHEFASALEEQTGVKLSTTECLELYKWLNENEPSLCEAFSDDLDDYEPSEMDGDIVYTYQIKGLPEGWERG